MERVKIKNWKRIKTQSGTLRTCFQLSSTGQPGLLYVRCKNFLVGFSYDLGELKEKWRLQLADEDDWKHEKYNSLFLKFGGVNVLVITSDSGLQLFTTDNNERPAKGPFLRFRGAFVAERVVLGNFYPDSKVLGVLASSQLNEMKFYGINESNLQSLQMNPLDSKPSILNNKSFSEFWSHRIVGTEFESIFIRTAGGIDCFYFDEKYNLQRRFSFLKLPSLPRETFKFLDSGDLKSYMIYGNEKSVYVYTITKNDMQFEREINCFGCDVNSLISVLNGPNEKSFAISGSNGFEICQWDEMSKRNLPYLSKNNLPNDILYSALIGKVEIDSLQDELIIQNANGDLFLARIENYQEDDIVAFQISSENVNLDSLVPTLVNNKDNTFLVRNKSVGVTLIPHLPWWTLNSLKFLENSVNIVTGQLELKIPILSAPVFMGNTLQITLYYSSGVNVEKDCGVGWNLGLPSNFITVDKKGSIYEDEFKYYVIGDQGRVELIPGEELHSFTSSSYKNSVFKYNKDNETWIVETPERILRFGGSKAIQWTLGWKNWAGAGTDISGMERSPLTWYLIESRELNYGVDFTYEYEQTNKVLQWGGPAFTYSTNLVKIIALNRFTISIDYEEKGESEYKKFAPTKTEPFTIPTVFESNKYIKALHFLGTDFQQHFKFNYQVKNSKRTLVSISQSIPPKIVIILTLKYLSGTSKLEAVTSNIGAKYNYQYEQVQIPELLPSSQSEYNLISKATVADGGNYKVFVYGDHRFSQSICIDVFEGGDGKRVAQVDYLDDAEFEINSWKDGFIVSIRSKKGAVTVHFFSKSKSEWQFDRGEQMSFTDASLMKFFNQGIAVGYRRDITLKNWNESKNNWQVEKLRIEDNIDALAVSGKFVCIISSENYLYAFFQKGRSWYKKRTMLENASTIKSVESVLSKFNHMTKELESLKRNFRTQMLQIVSNTILVSSIMINSNQIISNIEIFTIDKSYELKSRFIKEIARIQLLELFNRRIVQGNDGSGAEKIVIVFNHVLRNGIYVAEVTNIESESFDGAADRKTPIQMWNKSFHDDLKTANYVPWRKLMVFLNNNGVHTENYFIYNSGNEFKIRNEKYPLDSRIGANIKFKEGVLDKNKLEIESGEHKYSFYGGSKFINGYPKYLAYQDEGDIMFLSLNESGFISKNVIIRDTELIGANGTHIETMVKNSVSDSFSYDFKYNEVPISKFLASPAIYYVSREEINLKSSANQITNFRRRVAENNSVLVHKFWQDAEDFSGSQDILLIPSRCHIPEKVTKWCSCKGTLEKSTDDKSDSNNSSADNDGISQENVIYDKSGNKIIAKLAPYTAKDQEVSYYGFEDYEINISNWSFKEDQIRSGEALTGEKCLYVDETSKLIGKFKTKNQNTAYVLSSWIKLQEEVQIGVPIGEVTAKILYGSNQELMRLKALTQRGDGNWRYIELYLNFKTIRGAYFTFYTQQLIATKDLPHPSKVTFTFEIIFEPAENSDNIYIDYVRFSPISLDFEANVYEESTGRITHVLKADGQIENFVYDMYGQEIAVYDEKQDVAWFEVEHMTTLTPEITKQKMIFSFETGQFISLRNNVVKGLKLRANDKFSAFEGKLWCMDNYSNAINFPEELLSLSSWGFRFAYEISQYGLMQFIFGKNHVRIENFYDNYSKISINGQKIASKLLVGEIIYIHENQRVIIFIDGEQMFDQMHATPVKDLQFLCQNTVAIKDIMIFKGIGVTIEYLNEFGQKKQIIQMESERAVQIMENIYDSLGRSAITTKLTRLESEETNLLAFKPDFVTNERNIWESGVMGGLVSILNTEDEGFPYSRTTFHCSSLNIESAIGLPGKEYSVNGPFHKDKNMDINIPLLENLFPAGDGYHYEITRLPNKSLLIYVYDQRKNKVAKYVDADGYENHLATYNYDGNDNLAKVVSPNYYNNLDSMNIRLRSNNTNEDVQNIFFEYNQQGNVIKKISPDTGRQEYAYDGSGRKVLEYAMDLNGTNRQKIYYYYDAFGNLVETGSFIDDSNTDWLNISPAETTEKLKYQEFLLYDADVFAQRRSNKKKIVTYFNWNEPTPSKNFTSPLNLHGRVIDKIVFTRDGQISSKDTVIAANDLILTDEFKLYMLNYDNRGHYRILSHPLHDGDRFNLHHTYDKQGNLIGLGSSKEPFKYCKFKYNTQGNIIEEIHSDNLSHQFSREYGYNSPGFLQSITDPFLQLNYEYSKGGYGQDGFGDGMVMEMRSEAKWTRNGNPNWFVLNTEDVRKIKSKICLRALIRIGVISDSMKVLRMIEYEDFLKLPTTCSGSTEYSILDIIAKKHKTVSYAYKFRYGQQQELLNAKYYVQEIMAPAALTMNSLLDLLSAAEKHLAPKIWQSLVEANILIPDIKSGERSTIGRIRGELTSSPKLLDSVKNNYRIKQLLMKAFFQSLKIDKALLMHFFTIWDGCLDQNSGCNIRKKAELNKDVEGAYQAMVDSSVITVKNEVNVNIFRNEILDALRALPNSGKTVMRWIYDQKILGMLTHPFDFEAFDSDMNGNHKKFYRGFKRYKFNYKEFTSKIEKIELTDFRHTGIPISDFDFDYDVRGNTIKAKHKSIRLIKYHPVSQRTLEILMNDGRSVRFIYDSAGERIMKLVYNSENRLILRNLYIRDETGRVLTDVTSEYLDWPKKEKKVTETIYIYGTRGLVGFFRNSEFHSVLTDHAGSTRLIVKNGKVVASYDYFPYGEMQKKFIGDPKYHINYLFTGQELDEETGLYNYHARLYDPSIGRFYQPDPQAQYFNPYMYSGNSPVSLTDPDGEFALLITMFIGAVIGGYLGGAAVSNEWDPSKWNWKSGQLWGGIFSGAFGGALVPFTAPTAFAGLAIGKSIMLTTFALGYAYVNTAMANGNWDPTEWDWSSPKTINGLFTGFTSGLSLVSGFKVAHTSGAQFVQKTIAIRGADKIFLGVSYTVGLGYAYGKVAASQGQAEFWKWDFSDPAVIGGFLDAFDAAFGWPQNFAEMGRGMFKFVKVHKYLKSATNFKGMFKNLKSLEIVASNPLFKTTSSLVMATLMASSANEFSGEWKNDFSTYESFFGGIFFGKDIRNMIKSYNMIQTQGKVKKVESKYEKILKGSNLDISDIDLKKMLSNYMIDISDTLDAPRKTILENTLDDFLSNRIMKGEVVARFRAIDIGSTFTKKIRILDSSIDDEIKSKRTMYVEEEKPFLRCAGRRRRRAATESSFFESIKEQRISNLGNGTKNIKMHKLISNFKSNGHEKEDVHTVQIWCKRNNFAQTFVCEYDTLHILVHPLVGECQLQSTSQGRLLGDSYSQCRLVGGNVFCDGVKSTILVSQDPMPNILDTLTAQVMLFRLGMHVVGNVWQKVKNIFQPTTSPKSHEIVSEFQICQWEHALKNLEQMQAETGQDWVKFEIDECRELIFEISNGHSKTQAEVLDERLVALAEDLTECFENNLLHIAARSLNEPTNQFIPFNNSSNAQFSSFDSLRGRNHPLLN